MQCGILRYTGMYCGILAYRVHKYTVSDLRVQLGKCGKKTTTKDQRIDQKRRGGGSYCYLLVPIFSMAEAGGPMNSTPLD